MGLPKQHRIYDRALGLLFVNPIVVGFCEPDFVVFGLTEARLQKCTLITLQQCTASQTVAEGTPTRRGSLRRLFRGLLEKESQRRPFNGLLAD